MLLQKYFVILHLLVDSTLLGNFTIFNKEFHKILLSLRFSEYLCKIKYRVEN